MIDIILKTNGAKYYSLYTYKDIKNPKTGSIKKSYMFSTSIYAAIQTSGTENNVQGFVTKTSEDAGDIITADLIMYTKNKIDIKYYVNFDNEFFEIKSCEPFNNGMMSFYKSKLVKADNQNV